MDKMLREGCPDDPLLRRYRADECVVFHKTREAHGGLSNMAAGFPLHINDVAIRTSEALYQACRFPHLPDVQAEIIAQRSPMSAKMKGKPHRVNSRPDWQQVRVAIMRWCLRIKLAQNWNRFHTLLMETGQCPIVEKSFKDAFWGAKPEGGMLIGGNVLGRLLMEIRDLARNGDRQLLVRVKPPMIGDFLLYRQPIGLVEAKHRHGLGGYEGPVEAMRLGDQQAGTERTDSGPSDITGSTGQPSLFSGKNRPAAPSRTPAES